MGQYPASLAKRQQRSERRTAAVRLKLLGRTYQEVADELGYPSKGAAYRDIHKSFEETAKLEKETTDQLRAEEKAKLDMLWQSHIDDALKGDKRAAEVCLKISERRAKLLGLD